MGESDEDFVYLGTPISREEDTSARKRKAAAEAGQLRTLPAWKQEVRDEEGRRRFHGAFTGGFSAGFYNTVGSKEGWTPQTFTSSRKSRAEVKQQSIFSFLDDDEKTEMEGNVLGTSSKFDTFGFTAAELSRKQAEKDQQKRPSIIPGPIPDELVLPAVNSIGIKLLLKMGWRRGYSLKENNINSLYDARREARKAFLALSGNSNAVDLSESAISLPDAEVLVKEHGEALHSSQTTPVFVLNPKQDLHGLGYDPFKHAPEFRERKRLRVAGTKDQRHKTTLSRRDGLFSSNSGKIAPGFGIGALEELDVEDEDIYDYGFEVEDTCIEEDEQPSRITNNVKVLTPHKKQNILSGFKPALDTDYKLERFHPPDIPSNFEYHHKFSASLESAIKYVDLPPPEVPPPEDSNLKLLIDGFAALVSRCGKLFEDVSKERNKDNPLFSFLSDGDGHAYYVRKFWEEQQKRGDQKMLLKDVKSSSVKKLSAESRGKLLGEKPLQKSVVTPSTASTDVQYQSNLSDNFIKPSSLSVLSKSEKPFKDDPAKQERFEQFLKDKFEGGLRSTFSGGTSDWSETDRARERLDFEAVLDSLQKGQPTVQNNPLVAQHKLGLPLISEMKFISGGIEIVGQPQEEEKTLKRDQLKREEFQWRPAPILCKRFDIIDPFMGKPPPLPRAKSKMESIESFIFTKEFMKSEKIEETANAENATSLSRSEFKNDPEKITSSEPDLEPEDKSIHKPVDLYKAIFSDDSDDNEEQPVTNQISEPKKNTEGVNTTLNRLVAGDFLESLSKELGFEAPSDSGCPPLKTVNNSKGVTFAEDVKHVSHQENFESTCKMSDRGIARLAAGETISSAGSKQASEVPSQSGGDGPNLFLFKSGNIFRGHGNDKSKHDACVHEEKVEFQAKKHRINSKHQYNSCSDTGSSSDDEHRKGKVRKKRHRSRNHKIRPRNHGSSSSDDSSSIEYRSKDKAKEKVGVTSSRHSLHPRNHHHSNSSDTVASDDDDGIRNSSSSKIRRESSKERSRKHSKHHRHKSKKSKWHSDHGVENNHSDYRQAMTKSGERRRD